MTDTADIETQALVGQWSSNVSLIGNVRRYLRMAGWEEQPPGAAGALWSPPSELSEATAIAVPNRLDQDSIEWRGVVERLARVERRPQNDVALSIVTQYVDIMRLRAAGDRLISRTIPLGAGVNLVRSGYDMLRAAATTARRPRGQIGGNFSRIGDDIVRQSRMGHTENGSYVVPIWVPLTPPHPDSKNTPSLEGMEVERLPLETVERRATRTLAQSLVAAREVIVRPKSAPRRTGDLIPFVAAGGSRELVQALHRVISESAVAQFEAKFTWAGGLLKPGGVAETVEIGAEAAPRLEEAARLLKVPVNFPRQMYTGQIVVIAYRPGDKFGEITIDTVRQNRACEITVRVDRRTLDMAHDWARNERAILVEGEVSRGGPGLRLRIDRYERIIPVDETILPVSPD